jgi:hypothetical protein
MLLMFTLYCVAIIEFNQTKGKLLLLSFLHISFSEQIFAQLSPNTDIQHKPIYFKRKRQLYISYIQRLHQLSSMSNKSIPSFFTLPVELIYRILDQMDDWTMLCSMQNVCTRIDTIFNTYYRYQVNFQIN